MRLHRQTQHCAKKVEGSVVKQLKAATKAEI